MSFIQFGTFRPWMLAAGCFSRSHEHTLATGKALGLGADRLYRSFVEMAEGNLGPETVYAAWRQA